MCQGHVTSRVSRRCPGLSLCPSPPCAFRLALWFALRGDILMKPVEFVVHSSSLALTVSLDRQTVLMCSLHSSPYQVNCPGPLPHKIIEFAYFKQRLLTFHRSGGLARRVNQLLCSATGLPSLEWWMMLCDSIGWAPKLWRTTHFPFIISNPWSMLTEIGISFKISILPLKKWMFKEVP